MEHYYREPIDPALAARYEERTDNNIKRFAEVLNQQSEAQSEQFSQARGALLAYLGDPSLADEAHSNAIG